MTTPRPVFGIKPKRHRGEIVFQQKYQCEYDKHHITSNPARCEICGRVRNVARKYPAN